MKRRKLVRLTAFLLTITMLVGSSLMVYGEEGNVTEGAKEVPAEVTEEVEQESDLPVAPGPEETEESTEKTTPEATEETTGESTQEAAEETTEEPAPETTEEPAGEPAPETTEEPTEEPTSEATEEPAGEPAPETTEETTGEPTPEATDEPTGEHTPEPPTIPSEEPVTAEITPDPNTEMEELPADDEEEEIFDEDEEIDPFDEDGFVEFEDGNLGTVSEELLYQFNDPNTYEVTLEFGGTAGIEMIDPDAVWDENWDGRITLKADVRDANLSYRIVWEATDHDSRGWYTVGSGEEYSIVLTRENAAAEMEREYRVVIFTVD